MAKKTKKTKTPEIENFTNGQIEDQEIEKVKKLEEMLNVKSMNPFGTNDPKIFDIKLSEYSVSDMQQLCMRVGIYPTHNRMEMSKKLKQAFLRQTLGQRSVAMRNSEGISDPSHPNHEKAKKIMKEGF